jgi:hypothetical protein
MRTAEEVKARATKLRDSLNGLGHPIKHGQCLDVIAKFEGYSNWNIYTAKISANLNRAEQFVDEMLEGEAELSYAKFTQRFEKKYLIEFSERDFKREMREIREDYGDYVHREFLGCLKGNSDPEISAKYPKQLRYVWRGIFEKNELLMIAGIYCKNGTHHVSGFRYL